MTFSVWYSECMFKMLKPASRANFYRRILEVTQIRSHSLTNFDDRPLYGKPACVQGIEKISISYANHCVCLPRCPEGWFWRGYCGSWPWVMSACGLADWEWYALEMWIVKALRNVANLAFGDSYSPLPLIHARKCPETLGSILTHKEVIIPAH